MLTRLTSCRQALTAAIAISGALIAFSVPETMAAYPEKPIRILHGYAPGSSMDTNSRAIAHKLSELLGQSVVVEARPGATGAIASEAVANAAPDGYTLLAAPGSALASAPHLQPVRFNSIKDFTPVSIIGTFSYLLVANTEVPFKDVRGLIAAAKAEPGKINYGSNGTGSGYHLAGEQFAISADIDIVHLPYKGGGAAALSDLISNRIQLLWNSPVFLVSHVKSGKLRALGVTGSKRIATLPDVPTIAEAGLPNYEISGWQGIFAPAGLPQATVDTFHKAFGHALGSP
jgi:tripartite-type tricarboxylate transporter receptor subunit TctC